MNIFVLSEDPVECAKYMVDRHVVKMILETAQLLSTAHRVLDGEKTHAKSKSGRNITRWVLGDSRNNDLYSATHVNHPSAVWCRESVENYLWLVEHFRGLLDEYTFRYGKKHKTEALFYPLQSPPFNLKEYDMTPFALAMPDIHKTEDRVQSYRNYYREGKAHLHRWTKRDRPGWM